MGDACDSDDDNDEMEDEDDAKPFSSIEKLVSKGDYNTSIEDKNTGGGNTMADELARLESLDSKNKDNIKKQLPTLWNRG